MSRREKWEYRVLMMVMIASYAIALLVGRQCLPVQHKVHFRASSGAWGPWHVIDGATAARLRSEHDQTGDNGAWLSLSNSMWRQMGGASQ
jgi:hypothetical protein